MKRFLVFTYEDYYPSGGWSDFEAAFDTIEEVKENYRICGNIDQRKEKGEWANVDNIDVVDLEIMEDVSDLIKINIQQQIEKAVVEYRQKYQENQIALSLSKWCSNQLFKEMHGKYPVGKERIVAIAVNDEWYPIEISESFVVPDHLVDKSIVAVGEKSQSPMYKDKWIMVAYTEIIN